MPLRRPDLTLARALRRRSLPPGIERWRLTIDVGGARSTGAAEWAGAIVLVEAGRIEVECEAGGRRSFEAGDLLVLSWLPLRTIHNRGPGAARLLAVRRGGVKAAFVRPD